MTNTNTEATDIDTHRREIPGTGGLHLLDGENVLENRNPHWSHWTKTAALAAIAGLLALSAITDGNVQGFLTYGIIALGAVGYINYAKDKVQYIVTNHRVIKRVDLTRSSTGETTIEEIKSLATEQEGLGRLFGTGTVEIDSTGQAGLLGIADVKGYDQLAHTIRSQKQKTEQA